MSFPLLFFRVFLLRRKKHVKTQTEKEHTEKKENQSQAYGHPVYSALDMHLTDRIDKGDRLGVRVDLTLICECAHDDAAEITYSAYLNPATTAVSK
jgi:hypothetical protein